MALWQARRIGRIGAALALMAAPCLAESPDDSAAKVPPIANRDADRGEAMQILRDLNELASSLKSDKTPRGEAIPVSDLLSKVGRPARTVEKTSLAPSAIDGMLETSYQAAKVVPAKVSGDEEFVRRVTLDVTGKLPSPEQVVKFRQSTDKNKRAQLIDELLESKDFGVNWGRYWKDVVQFHATPANAVLVRFPMMEDWMAEQFNKNRPWDEIVSEVITATGNTGENGAAVLAAAHAGQAVELAGEISRVFMGVQIQCAQCHDHPSDSWKREQFHEFAAFFGGIQARPNRTGGENGPGFDVSDRKGKASYSMPDLKDPSKNIPVAPKFMYADAKSTLPANLSATQRRALAASYVTGQDNPWFARSFVNRVWTALLGDGFYNPVDDLGPTRDAHNREVLDTLAAEWQKGGYDVRWLYRTILNTKTYQREFRPSTASAGKVPFAANCPSRLRSDQIIDALSHALGVTFDNRPAGKVPGQVKGAANKNAQKAVAAARNLQGGPRALFNQTFGVDPSIPSDEILGTIPQALFFMNSPIVNGAITRKNGTVLAEILAKSPNEREALEALYLRVLARSPSADEVKTCGKYIKDTPNRREAFEDILWALVNSTEFLSRK